MCFHFASVIPSTLAAECFGSAAGDGVPAPSWNVKPGQHARAIRHLPGTPHRRLDALCWAFVPSHVRSGRNRNRVATITARQVASSRMTGEAFRLRRCLIPATAIYEPGDRPTAVESTDRQILALAAVWDRWCHPSTGEWHDGFAVIMQDAPVQNEGAGAPAPLVIYPEDWAVWLGEHDGNVKTMLTASAGEHWRRWPVSRRVFNTDDDDAKLLLPFDQLQHGEARERPDGAAEPDIRNVSPQVSDRHERRCC